MTADHPRIPLRDFFAGVAEYAFGSRLGVADPPLVDYITDLLTRFVRHDALYSIRDLAGNRLHAVGEMLAEADTRVGEARREVHRHIGDFALFWTGLYPEALRKRTSKGEMDRFGDYCVHGKRAYFIASTIEADSQDPAPNDVLERLSRQFEMCAYGLREVRREWERREDDPESPNPLLLN